VTDRSLFSLFLPRPCFFSPGYMRDCWAFFVGEASSFFQGLPRLTFGGCQERSGIVFPLFRTFPSHCPACCCTVSWDLVPGAFPPPEREAISSLALFLWWPPFSVLFLCLFNDMVTFLSLQSLYHFFRINCFFPCFSLTCPAHRPPVLFVP